MFSNTKHGVFLIKKYIKIMFFLYIFTFNTSIYQNYLKASKNINLIFFQVKHNLKNNWITLSNIL
jgi:hypothetical protein